MPKNGNRASHSIGKTHGKAAPAPEPNEGNKPPYLVSEIMKAYNADSLPVNGAGQTIAILIDTFPSTSDLEAFWTANSVPSNLNRVEMINVGGRAAARAIGRRDVGRGVDQRYRAGRDDSHLCQRVARLRRFGPSYRPNYRRFAPLNRGMRQLSISLGLGESYMVKETR